jgi:hypothetical protein
MDAMNLRTCGEVNFGRLDLGDARRTARLVTLFDTMAKHPGGTLPDKLSDPADLRAFYRLMRRRAVTHARIMAGHMAATRDKMIACSQGGGVVLNLHDATELDYTTLKSLADQLGQIGQGTHVGYICHNSLAVQAQPQRVLGLSSQILHHRANVSKNETIPHKRERENRESRLWMEGAQQSGPAPEGCLWVDVSDSLSDTFEYMAFEISTGRHFVLRSRENRKLNVAVGSENYLYEAVRKQAPVAAYEVMVQGTAKRKARKARVQVSFTAVEIAPPGKKLGEYENRPLAMWAVRVWEPHPPQGAEALEWILLTNVPVLDDADALERVKWYEMRWIVEDLHKGMKTGCGIESLQFTTIDRLEPAIAVLSVLATTLLELRDAARQPDADVRPATDVVSTEYVEVLTGHYGARMGTQPSILKFYLHVARLGGHQNRKKDLPGWITLWRGWMKLESMLVGYRVARKKTKRCGLT